MFIGMSVVFSFLTIMVISMYIMSYLINLSEKLFPEPINITSNTLNNSKIAAAIAAVKHHTR
jgi:Na+-transporting methylmalonyl-CoA/oxaloacetate decarboxylase gamma subunit